MFLQCFTAFPHLAEVRTDRRCMGVKRFPSPVPALTCGCERSGRAARRPWEGNPQRAIVERLLEGDADKAETQEEIALAQQMGITGVPTFLVGNRYAVIGAREPQVIAGAIAKVLEEREAATA